VILDLALGLVAGIAAGAVFFGGLRWTLDRLAASRRPLGLAAASFAVRSAAVAGLLVVVSGGSASRVLAGLAGLLVVRTVLVGRARRSLADAGREEAPWI